MKYFKGAGVLFLVLMLTGCATTARKRAAAANELRLIGVSSITHTVGTGGQLPKTWADLAPFLGGWDPGDAYELVASGTLKDYPDPTSAVLARQKDAYPDGSRLVVYLDGHVEIQKSE